MKLYLAGPMTGIKDFNFPTFMRYAELLRQRGHVVANPAEISLEMHGIQWKGELNIAENQKLASVPLETYLEKDNEAVDDSDAIAVLVGWRDSRGATAEVTRARSQGKHVYSAVLLCSSDMKEEDCDITDEVDVSMGFNLEESGVEDHPADFVRAPELEEMVESFEHYADNPERQRAITGAVKDNRSKARVDLIPSSALIGASVVLGYGAHKYKPHNWRLGLSWTQTFASLQRHLLAFNDGEDIDPESGLPHIDHAMCQLMFLSHYYHTGEGEDDRFTSSDREEAKA